MFSIIGIPAVAQVALPIGLLAWLALGRHPSRLAWVFAVLTVGGYCVAIAIVGLWLVVPPNVSATYLVAFLLACVWSVRRLPALGTAPHDRRGRVWLGARAASAALALVLAAYATTNWRSPRVVAVDLTFPLHGGGYYVANGGSLELANAHRMTLANSRYRAYRGQSYGVDIVRLNDWGVRARGLLPNDPAAYVIFGAPVYAPCAGTVVVAADGYSDQSPPNVDRAHLAGNHVVLDCGGAWVVLGHFQRATVRVHVGQTVCVGEPLGNVGNSGNTSEPHLHIHAQRPGTAAEPLGGDPLPVRFDGRTLVRNSRISGPLESAPEGIPVRPDHICMRDTRETP